MDRFIGDTAGVEFGSKVNLKSNMDRFIGETFLAPKYLLARFKIQYG